jgi:hypothetical protein
MNAAKYIIIDDGMCLTPVVFPEFGNHRDVARGLVGADGIEAGQVLSAGFVKISTTLVFINGYEEAKITVQCYGKSVSLDDLEARPEDARLIEKALGLG